MPTSAFEANSGQDSEFQTSMERVLTDPETETGRPRLRVKKRIIVCCDGTWQDGITTKNRLSYTNILRLARTIEHEDFRTNPPTPQIVFYQSGIGSADNFYSEYIEGTTGDTLADKVEEAYAFIAHNYYPGDEIFLFGFSRGAYTARMVAMFIGAIGVLDRKDMDEFAGIFITYQNLGKSKDKEEIRKLNAKLAPFNSPDSPGIRRAYAADRSFSVKCVGVFDTVGTLGLPEELTLHSPKLKRLFGFPDHILGEHIHQAYQALALNETRKDFTCAKFEQKEEGRRKGQKLEQCWFTGCHSDIGGGYKHHDLSDLTLTWMVANVSGILAMDLKYLASLPKPHAPWGAQKPHDPTTGIFALSFTTQRPLPTGVDNVTHEHIHPSVLEQSSLYPELEKTISEHPQLICTLLPLEEELKRNWPYNPIAAQASALDSDGIPAGPKLHHHHSKLQGVADEIASTTSSILRKFKGEKSSGMKTESGMPVDDDDDE